MARFKVLKQGWVTQRRPDGPLGRAGGSRCTVTRSGDVVCTYMVQSAMGCNDFRPFMARSGDGGMTWSDERPLWPEMAEHWAVFASVSRAPDGELFVFGSRTRVEQRGESFWCDETQGLKANELIWSRSRDEGRTWGQPEVIPMPVPGSAEAPGAMCITRGGRWLCCYSPYHTFDPAVKVDRGNVIVLASDDEGKTWRHANMLSFAEMDSGGAEAWVIELADGHVLGASWHMDLHDRQDYSNAYALSSDGLTWGPTRNTGIKGQSVGLAALLDGRALMVYNQRKHGQIGVWAALARPTDQDFGIEANQIIWAAATATRSGTTGDHGQWTDFAFGEPAAVVLDDAMILAVLWVDQPDGRGIRYVQLQIID